MLPQSRQGRRRARRRDGGRLRPGSPCSTAPCGEGIDRGRPTQAGTLLQPQVSSAAGGRPMSPHPPPFHR
eukprot:11015155-Lingulodinium_polyedra.AAC.1